jgi:NAD(P)-dependent dehydrogenase (short-subunit alcohol dehydrogenase family)
MTQNIENKVVVITGASSGLGEATARHLAAQGAKLVLAARREDQLQALAEELKLGVGAAVATDVTDAAQVKALVDGAVAAHGRIDVILNNAGLMPHSPLERLRIDDWDRMIDVNLKGVLYGIAAALPHMTRQKSGHIINVSSVAAYVLEEFGSVIADGGSGIVIASQSGHRLPPLSAEENAALATTPVEELLSLPMLQLDQVKDSLHAYQLAKRGNSLRVMAEAVRWGKRGARVNTISPGIIITPLANDELKGPRGPGYRRMIEVSAAGRAGTPDEVGTVGALLMGSDGAFITGSDFLMDGGVTAAYWFGDLAPK